MTVPLTSHKHGKPSLINPDAFVEYHRTEGAYRDQPTPRAAILCYHRGFAEHVLQRHQARHVPGFFGDTYLLESTGHSIALVANFGIGAPVAAIMLEDVIALGATHVVSIGTTGALQPDLNIGDVVLVDRALRDEGTSHHYLPADVQVSSSAELRRELAATLERNGTRFVQGDVWTTDAPYRETADEVRVHAEAGVLAVEMEAAALFAVGSVRQAEVAALVAVSDSLAGDDGWAPSFHADETLAALDLVFDTALEALQQCLRSAGAAVG